MPHFDDTTNSGTAPATRAFEPEWLLGAEPEGPPRIVRRLPVSALSRAADAIWSSDRLTVVSYRRIAEPSDFLTGGDISATPEAFATQMDYLARWFNPITIDELVDYVTDGVMLPERAVLIALDGGFRDAYDVALPVLRARGLPATVFVAMTERGRPETPRSVDCRRYLTWDEACEMDREGISLQVQVSGSADDAAEEVAAVGWRLGRPVQAVTCAGCGHDPAALRAVGVRVAFSSDVGPVRCKQVWRAPFAIPRLNVSVHDDARAFARRAFGASRLVSRAGGAARAIRRVALTR